MLSQDEALGLIGQTEVLKHNIERGRQALIAYVEGRLGEPEQPNVGDIIAFNNAIQSAGDLIQRMQAESADPDGAFGDWL